MKAPLCEYCGDRSKHVTGKDLYPHRPELSGKNFYRCDPCRAWVGCHPGTLQPLGRLANASLRKAKLAAHAAFDPIWHSDPIPGGARKRGYLWLARQLGIHRNDCHIGMFDEDMCRRVVEICNAHLQENAA